MLLNRKISILYFVNQIKSQILLIICFAIFVGYIDTHPWLVNVSLPLPVTAILGTAVSLLLAFRTSQSYDRWWEARKIWGAIVNDSRTFIRQVAQFIPEDKQEEVKAFAERQIIWTFALGEALRKQPFSDKVKAYLTTHNIEATNIPNALIDEHSKQIKRLAKENILSEFQVMQLTTTLSNFCNSMGMCERIKNTVFPRAYSLLLHTLIYVFTLLLPFGLDDAKIVVEIALTILIPIIFISIEKTAIIMQDPFENSPVDIPVTALAQTIEVNIRQMIGEKATPNKQNENLYYQM
ncbi:MAG: hypothetical protein HY062_17135 [Bacteroidetes bacterium]|nr:hypothetical protein [Bacteroidota bacterium]